MHRVRAPNCLWPRFAEPEITHLAGLDQIAHRADSILNRHIHVDPMLIVQIDAIDAESLQGSITSFANILRPAVYRTRSWIGRAALNAKLRRDYYRVAQRPEHLPNQLLVLERPIRIGRIKEVDAELKSAIERRNRLGLIRSSVELGHAHAAQPLFRYDQPLRSKFALLHWCSRFKLNQLVGPAPRSIFSRIALNSVPGFHCGHADEFATR